MYKELDKYSKFISHDVREVEKEDLISEVKRRVNTHKLILKEITKTKVSFSWEYIQKKVLTPELFGRRYEQQLKPKNE